MEQTLRIIQIEDSLDDAELILRELRREGYQIESLRVDTPAALADALSSETWDLVLSDHEIPGFGGMAALRLVLSLGIDIPFIVVSGAIGEDVAVAAMKAGAHDYVFKGNLARLGPAIERELKEFRIREKERAAASSLQDAEQQQIALFEHSPLPTWVEDFSTVKHLWETYRSAGVKDLDVFLLEHPEEVRRCIDAVKIVEVNQRSLDFFGCDKKADFPLVASSLFMEASFSVLRDKLVALERGDMTFAGELALQNLQGETKFVSLSLSVCPNSELSRVLISFSDITHRVVAEESLRNARTSLEIAQRIAHIGSWEWDLSHQQTSWSPQLFRMFGLDPSLPAPDYENFVENMVHPEDKARLLATTQKVIVNKDSMNIEYGILRQDGETRYVQAMLEPVPGDALRLRGTVQDITEKRRLEKLLKGMERLSVKGQMAAYIAHEINNPLAGIKSAFTLIKGAVPKDNPHYAYVGLIDREIDRIAGIISTMYHIYRPEANAAEQVCLREAFQDVIQLLTPMCRAHEVSIRLDLHDPRYRAHMNPGLLRQVIFNLTQNAIEASPPQSVVSIMATADSGTVHITVEDKGSGIPPELEERIFEPGFTTKHDTGMSGLGLGLSACRNIVEAAGGSLNFCSNACGVGTQFRVCLPRHSAQGDG